MTRAALGATMLGILLATASLPAAAAEDRVVVGLGAFEAFDMEEAAVEARFEWRSGLRLGGGSDGAVFQGIGPLVGFMANGHGGVFGYGGLLADFRFGERWSLQPSAGIGGYGAGDGKDLGGVFQFHLGAELAYVFENQARLGIYATHISHAGLHDGNRGADSLLVTVSFPLERLLPSRDR